MKTVALFFVLIISQLIFSQEKTDTLKVRYHLYNEIVPLIYYNGDMNLNYGEQQFPLPDSTNLKLLTSFMLSGGLKDNLWNVKSGPGILSNYHEFYLESTKWNTLKMMLGAAEAGAVGYLAYRHFKKYGFK